MRCSGNRNKVSEFSKLFALSELIEYTSHYFSIQLVFMKGPHRACRCTQCGFEYAVPKQVKDLQVPVQKVQLTLFISFFLSQRTFIKML